ncbi:MAG: hypothetical protein CMC08_08585 [Flavobacteriaceae bacterium]|nr:hypothetical protein [Flavobacteriaceae bacterium]
MQLKGVFFLLIFSGFLILPAVVVLADVEVNMTSYFSMTEEETSDGFKAAPKDRSLAYKNLMPEAYCELTKPSEIEAGYQCFWKAVYFETLSPPPEFLLA